jgi:hypothetical protein
MYRRFRRQVEPAPAESRVDSLDARDRMAGMSEAASKRDVLEALRGLLKHRTEDLGCYEFVLEAWIESAADEIERLRDERRWIPVGERLPEPDTFAIVATKDGVCEALYGLGGIESADEPPSWLVIDYGEVRPTHWMPLPEPPRHA